MRLRPKLKSLLKSTYSQLNYFNLIIKETKDTDFRKIQKSMKTFLISDFMFQLKDIIDEVTDHVNSKQGNPDLAATPITQKVQKLAYDEMESPPIIEDNFNPFEMCKGPKFKNADVVVVEENILGQISPIEYGVADVVMHTNVATEVKLEIRQATSITTTTDELPGPSRNIDPEVKQITSSQDKAEMCPSIVGNEETITPDMITESCKKFDSKQIERMVNTEIRNRDKLKQMKLDKYPIAEKPYTLDYTLKDNTERIVELEWLRQVGAQISPDEFIQNPNIAQYTYDMLVSKHPKKYTIENPTQLKLMIALAKYMYIHSQIRFDPVNIVDIMKQNYRKSLLNKYQPNR